MRVLLSKSAYVKYITRKVKLRNKTRPFIVGSEFSFFFLEIFVQRPIGKCNHIHLLFLTQIIPQSPSHKHFLFPRQSPSVEQVLPQNCTLFVLGQPLEPMKTRKWKFAIFFLLLTWWELYVWDIPLNEGILIQFLCKTKQPISRRDSFPYELEVEGTSYSNSLTQTFRTVTIPNAIFALNLFPSLKLIFFITGKCYPRVVFKVPPLPIAIFWESWVIAWSYKNVKSMLIMWVSFVKFLFSHSLNIVPSFEWLLSEFLGVL